MALADPLLKTQPVAEALGVSVSTIKRWVDSGALPGTRTVGRHRLVPYSEALKFARRQGFPLERLEALGEGGLVAAATDGDVCEALFKALGEGDRERARALIFAAYETTGSAAALGDRVIRPVMERFGHGWIVGAMDVFHEHQASQIVGSALSALNDRLGRSVRWDAPLALGCAPEGDFYQLPLILCEAVLREVGWDVRNLGPNLPARSLAAAILRYRPRLVFLTVSHLADQERFVQEHAGVLEAARSVGAAIMLGGRALSPELRARTICAGFGDRMIHLAEFASRLTPQPDARSGLLGPSASVSVDPHAPDGGTGPKHP